MIPYDMEDDNLLMVANLVLHEFDDLGNSSDSGRDLESGYSYSYLSACPSYIFCFVSEVHGPSLTEYIVTIGHVV